MRRPCGFTLLEMLVAIAIFAIVGAIAYTGLDRALAIRAQLHSVRLRWQARGLAYYRLANDLAQARARPVRDGAGTLLPAFVVRRMGRGLRLNFTTGGTPSFQSRPASNLRRVDYTVMRGQLIWRRWAVLDRAPGERRVKEVLMRGVRTWQIRLLASNGLSIRSWPLAGQPAADPSAVKVVLTLQDGRHLRWFFPVGR